STPEDIRCLFRENVTHVIDCRLYPSEEHLYHGTGIVRLHCGVLDDGRPKPDPWFHQGMEFAVDALQAPHARVLVHCRFGMSRAPSMTYAILRVIEDVPGDEAEARIR